MFSNKVVLITGGSRGIGRATAIKFAKENAKVIIVFKSNVESAKSLVKEIEEFGGEIKTIQADLSKQSELKMVVDKALDFYGRIDILINNAGILCYEQIGIAIFNKRFIYEICTSYLC